MALTPKRYNEVDEQLQELQAYLVSLSGELGQVTPTTDHSCQPCQAAKKAADKIADLRYLLAVAEARRQVGETQEQRVPVYDQVRQSFALNSLALTVRSSLPVLRRLTERLG